MKMRGHETRRRPIPVFNVSLHHAHPAHLQELAGMAGHRISTAHFLLALAIPARPAGSVPIAQKTRTSALVALTIAVRVAPISIAHLTVIVVSILRTIVLIEIRQRLRFTTASFADFTIWH